MHKEIIQIYEERTGRKFFDDAWLNLNEQQITEVFRAYNPLEVMDSDDLAASVLRMMRTPEYLFWAAKILLGVTLHPMQAVILEELWKRPFPMLIASRGAAKSFLMAVYILLKLRLVPGSKIVTCGAAFRQSRLVFETCEKLYRESDILRSTFGGSDGPKTSIDRCVFNIGNSVAYFIPIGCLTGDTLVSTSRGLKYMSQLASQIPGELTTLGAGESAHPFSLFYNNGEHQTYQVTTNLGYSFQGNISHKMKVWRDGTIQWVELKDMKVGDSILIDAKPRWWDPKYNWDNKQCLKLAKYLLRDNYKFMDKAPTYWKEYMPNMLGRYKYIPEVVLGGTQENISTILNYIFREKYFITGNANKARYFNIKLHSEKLSKQIHFLLLHYGIVGRLYSVTRPDPYLKKKRKREYIIRISEHYFRALKNIVDLDILETDYPLKSFSSDKIYKIEKKDVQIVYDVHVPETHTYCANGFISHNSGDTIRGLRSTTIICDEFSSINPDIYETVISGFGSVNKDPITSIKIAAKRQAMIQQGLWTAEMEAQYEPEINQSIITGTCGYDFEHFARYWKLYKSILETKGNPDKLDELGVDRDSWKYYSIIRIPYELMPPNFMNEQTVERSKLSMTRDAFYREYNTIFTKDSEGFFKKSLLKAATATPSNKISDKEGNHIIFTGKIKGDPDKKYIMGVDAASEKDNFAVCILEMHEDHTRVVYSWAFNRARHTDRIKAGLAKEHDYFQYCVGKIRDLCNSFNICRIMMDAQGGGRTIQQALSSPKEGGAAFYEIIEENKPKVTDDMVGSHIVEMCQFANAKWTSEANHGMKFDLENRLLLFPDFDQVVLALSYEDDYNIAKKNNPTITPELMSMYDTLEDCLLDIEQMKEEMSTIVVTKSGSTERWDTPEIRENGKKGRLRKDRYSALLLANMGARQTGRIIAMPPSYTLYGIGVGQGMTQKSKNDRLYKNSNVSFNPRGVQRNI